MQLYAHLFKMFFMFVSVVVGMDCMYNSQCTDVLDNTVCSSSQCACATGYTGNDCTGKSLCICDRPKDYMLRLG